MEITQCKNEDLNSISKTHIKKKARKAGHGYMYL